MGAYARERNARFVVLSFFDFNIMEQESQFYNETINSVMEDDLVEYIDVFPLFERRYKECGFYADVGHPGPLGNRLIFHLIADQLHDNWVPGAANSSSF